MRLIAHRGFAGIHPENTLEAVSRAAQVADEVEVDARRCESGELVVIHDATVDRVTDGEGAVARHTLSELRDLDVLGTDEGVPTLREVFETVPSSIGVNVELKEVGLANDVLALAAATDAQVTVSSFHANELEGCRGIDPEVPRAYLFDDDANHALEFARDLDCCYLHPAAEACTAELVEAAHGEGMCVNVWTVDCREDADRLADLGVDGLIADYAKVLPRVEH